MYGKVVAHTRIRSREEDRHETPMIKESPDAITRKIEVRHPQDLNKIPGMTRLLERFSRERIRYRDELANTFHDETLGAVPDIREIADEHEPKLQKLYREIIELFDAHAVVVSDNE